MQFSRLFVAIFLLFTFHFAFITPVFAHTSTQVIKITPEGYQPESVTVDQNSVVIFLNEDTKDHWPASNPHPTHDLYPEFDPKAPIKPGGSWVFGPKKPGEWKYHDHLFPHLRSVLNVTKEVDVNQTDEDKGISIFDKLRSFWEGLVNKVKGIFARNQTISSAEFVKLSSSEQLKKLQEIADLKGADQAWQFVKETFKGQSGSSGNIHDLAHLSGNLIFQKKGFEGIKFCSSDFAFGCYHGFLDKAFEKNLDHLLDAQNACLQLGPENSGPVASCIHGIGHGVASFYLTADLKKSLASCGQLTSGREFCFDGVFMEYVRNAPETTFKKDDPYYPCDELEVEFGSVYSFACGRNQPALLTSRFNFTFDDLVGVCLNWVSEPSKMACVDALGFILAGQADQEAVISGCQKLQVADLILKCIKSAAGELVFQEAPDWQSKSKAICQSLGIGVDECLAYVDSIIKQYGRQVKINFRPLNKDEDINSYIRSQLKLCYDNEGRDGCYKQVADTLYNQFGLKKNLELLKQNENYQEVFARCHEVTHYLSRLEFEKLASIAKVYAQCDSTCHGGCYHGTLEAYLKQKTQSSGFSLNRDFSKICGKEEDYQKPLEFNECLHGLGHAAMFVYDMELKKSLVLCDTLSVDRQRERCYTGVFMENSSSSTSFDHQSIYIKADDPFYPCNFLEERYLSLCWQYQSSYFSILSHQDWNKVADLCLQVPKNYQDNCFKTIGTNQVGFTQDMKKMKNDCDSMPSSHFQDICVTGVVSSLAYRFVGDIKKMVDFCDMVDSDNKESCFRQLGTGLLEWSNDKNLARKNCEQIRDSDGSAWCLSVI